MEFAGFEPAMGDSCHNEADGSSAPRYRGPACGDRALLRAESYSQAVAFRVDTDRPIPPESDIDVLVEFEADAAVTYLDLARMERELSELLGRKVDLRTAEELSRYFRERVVSEALLQYERR
jgi:Nucleotidyltransferase domain